MVSSSSRLSQYELLGELGRGGSSVVYAARDTLLERDVAVKILNVETAADRPQREVQAAATLNHPGIARIYEAGEDNGRRFIAMELIRGSTLGGILEKGPLPIEIALDYSRQILNALEAAHSASVVHRDLKPSNIMVQSDGRTKIVDFGLAKVTSPANGISMSATTSLDWSRITAEGSFAGTLAYMSPEQAEGKAVDARSDIFSFGAVLYEMLTGTSPFARESPVATMVAVMSHNPERDAAIPAAIWPILERTLRKDPLERWKSAGDLSYSLQIAIGPDSIEEGIRTRGPQPSRRRFLWWSAGLGSLAAAAGFVAGRGTTHRTVPTFEQLTFDSGAIQTARFGSDGQSAYVAFRAPGSEKYEVCEIEFGARSLKKLDLPAGYIQGLSTKGELALVLQTSSAMLARASRHGGPVKLLADQTYYASWAPDGDTVMAVRNLPAKGRIEYPLGTVLAEADSARGFPFQYANLSRGGRKIAYFRPEKHSRHEELVVIDVGPPASPARLLSSDWAFTSPLHWTSDDSAVWFSGAKPGRHSGIWSVDLRGNERCLIEAPGQIILQDIRSSDGAALIASHDQKTSIRVESADGNLELELPGSMLAGMSDDGSTFMTVEPITGSQSHTLFLFVKRNRAPVRVGECQVASLSRDGNFVATATLITGDGGQRLLIIPVGPGAVQDVTKPGFFWEVLDWFGDGRRIMATGRGPGTDRKTFVLSLEDHSYVPIDTAEAWGERISLDGQRLLMHNLAGERSVMDLSSRRITRLDIPSDAAELTWSADGKSIFFADKAGSDSGVSIRRLDVNSGESTLVRKTHVRGPVAPVGNPLIITPDGAHVAYLSSETNSTLYMIHGLS